MVRKGPSLKVRFILYPVIAGLFLLGCYFISLYAMGYNLKIVNGKLVQEKTGSIIMATRPGDAKVYLDGEPYKKSTPMFSFFDLNIDRLPVGEHTIRVEKEGYETWNGKFVVKSGLVSWGNYILLLPREREYSEYSLTNTTQVIISQDQTRAAVLTEDKENKIVAIHEINSQNKNKEKIYEARILDGESYVLKEFSWDEGRLYYEKKSPRGTLSFSVETASGGVNYPLFTGLKTGFTIEGFNPRDNKEIYLRYGQSLHLYNYQSGSLSKVIVEGVESVHLTQEEAYFIKNTNGVKGLWRVAQEPQNLIKELPVANSYVVDYIPRERVYAVLAGKDLILYHTNGSIKNLKVDSNVDSFKATENGKYLVYQTGGNLKVYEVAKREYFTALENRKIEQFIIAEDESNFFFKENGKLKMVNYNGAYENEISTVKEFPIFISNNYNLYFVAERADKKMDLKVFSFNL